MNESLQILTAINPGFMASLRALVNHHVVVYSISSKQFIGVLTECDVDSFTLLVQRPEDRYIISMLHVECVKDLGAADVAKVDDL